MTRNPTQSMLSGWELVKYPYFFSEGLETHARYDNFSSESNSFAFYILFLTTLTRILWLKHHKFLFFLLLLLLVVKKQG
jgi:hypothetical protein